jgi:predicted MFS family arabinose efflux permease
MQKTTHEQTPAADLLTLTFTRLVINMTRRFPYPFLPEISRQLSVPLEQVQSTIAGYAGIGVASPLLGPIGERYGRKRVMMGALWLMVAGAAMGALMPQFALFAIATLIFGVSKMLFDPAMSAYIADHVPYVRRGAAVGITELSWAGSMLVIAPIAGYLLGASGLQSVFLVLLGFALVALLVTYRFIPADHPQGDVPRPITPLETWRALRAKPSSFGALGYSFFFVVANEIFFINYGAYMETTFREELAALGAALALGALAALGTVTIVISAAEVVGEFSVIGFADRFGKRRLTILGALVASVGYVALPTFSSSLPLTLFGLFIIFVGVETAIVAAIPLLSEVLPNARAIMMSSNVGAHSLGRMVGALAGAWLAVNLNNFVLTGAIATGLALLSTFLLWRYLHEKD